MARGGKRNAVIYVRISRDTEGRELGVQRQEKLCRQLGKRLGWTVVAVLSDNDISASTRSKKRRPAYERMLAMIDAGEADAILAYSLSRLTRRPFELEGLITRAEEGLAISTVAAGEIDLTTANGRAMARTLAAFDAREAEEASERAKVEREQRRQRGRWNGGPRPFGWERDGMTPRPVEQQLIEEACRDLLSGKSLRAVARHWTAVLGRSTTGQPAFNARAVRDAVANPRIAGLLHDGRKAAWPPIVSEDTWRGLVAVLSDPARKRVRGNVRLLTGIALCGRCGALVHAGVDRHGNPTYRCTANQHLDRRAERVDDYVRDVVLAYLERQGIPTTVQTNTNGLAQQAQMLRARLDEAAELFAAGTITAEQLKRATTRLRADLEDVEARMVAGTAQAALRGLTFTADALRTAWERADVNRRRAIIQAAGVQITIHPPGRGVVAFDPDTVEITWRTS